MMVQSGLAGVQLEHGDHVCAFYNGKEQRDEVMLPYLEAGLRAHEHCLSVVDEPSPELVLRALASWDDADLRVLTAEDAYLIDGHFDTERMLSLWEADAFAARESSVGVRAVGEMTWSLREVPGVDELVTYEERLNAFLLDRPEVILCLYDLELFSGAIVMAMLSIHAKVLMNGAVRWNPYCTPGGEFLHARPGRVEA